MRKHVLVGLAAALGIAALGVMPASACSWRGGCGPYGYYASPAHSYYAPPVYYAPPRVYYAPPPAYNYYAAPRVYYAPVPAYGFYAAPYGYPYYYRLRSYRRFSPL